MSFSPNPQYTFRSVPHTFGDDGLKRFDAGLGLGVAFEFGNIVVGVETGTSFTKVASGVSAHNLSALATIGYKF